ncbi:MAG: hypothetical protein FJ388_10585 [Verrucomicrobia bacterium]|nr:hypothetical protein [Verrucomicrobiota bacterium]
MKRIAALWLALTASLWGAELVVPWEKAREVIGQRATVEGTVVATHRTEKVCNLNFSPNWRKDFSAVIFAGSFSKWQGDIEGQYRGKKVRVTGTVTEYQGRPQIVVSEPSQIEVVKEPAATVPPVVTATTPAPSPPTTTVPLPVSPGQAAAARAPATPNVSAPAVGALTLSKELAPFTVEVKRFTGAKQGSGVVTKTGASFFQMVRLNVTISNTRNTLVGPLEWQWVIGLFDVSSSGDMKQQFFTGSGQMELRPLEKKVVQSDDVTLAGMSSNLGMRSGQKLRGHFVRVFYQGRLVFEEANPPAMKPAAENYLAGK